MSDRKQRGLVLGGGGVAGIAWEYGLLAALEDRGIDLNGADVAAGTSAGSVVGAALRQGAVQAAYASQSVAVETESPAMAGFDVQELMGVFAAAQQEPDETSALALIGSLPVGSPQEVIDAIMRRVELLGIDRFMGQIDVGNLPWSATRESLELCMTEVAPVIRREAPVARSL